MILTLYRTWRLPTYTIGRLFINTQFVCNTLEDPVRVLRDENGDGDFDDPGEGKIYGNTAIPAGTYKVTLTYSPKFKRTLPLLLRVPGFKGIMIHSGNSTEDTHGCILPGENKMKGRVLNSRTWEEFIVRQIQAALDNREEIKIKICDQ